MTRFAYLDESGIGSAAKEPFLVVAGILVDADKQWKMLERYLSDMADEFALPDDRPDFCFHATQLMNGGGGFGEKYTKEKRLHFLQALCEIPEKFGFLVVVSVVDRATAAAKRNRSPADREEVTTSLQAASGACASMVDEFMRLHAGPEEVAIIVHEANGEFSKAIRAYHNFLRTPIIDEWAAAQPTATLRTLERVVDTAMFAGKTDSSPLQVADACAYILARRRRRVAGDERFYEHLRKQIVYCPKLLFSDLDDAPPVS